MLLNTTANVIYKDFVDHLTRDKKDYLKNKITALFALYDIKKGRLFNQEKCRKLHLICKGCFEFKIKQYRVSFVKKDKDVFLLSAFIKKSNKLQKIEKQKIEKLCNMFHKLYKGGHDG